jgi:hypothetical protein
VLAGRQDVQHRQARYTLRVVERQTIGHSTASIVAGHAERREAEVVQQGHHVAGHGALRVRLEVGGGRWLGAIAIAAQIRRDHGEVIAAIPHADCRLAGVYRVEPKSVKRNAQRNRGVMWPAGLLHSLWCS